MYRPTPHYKSCPAVIFFGLIAISQSGLVESATPENYVSRVFVKNSFKNNLETLIAVCVHFEIMHGFVTPSQDSRTFGPHS